MLELFNHINFTTPIAFALTYLLHSTIWILIVGLLVRTSRFRSLSLKNYLWRAALVGGVLTSLFATMHQQKTFSIKLNQPQPIELTIDNNLERGYPNLSANRDSKNTEWTSEVFNDTSLKYLGLFWILGTTFFLIKLILEHWFYFRKINPREAIQNSSILSLFYKVQKKANIKKDITLSKSYNLNSPILIGDSEICLPTKAIKDLEATQLKGMIAHELAHIVRNDYYWTLGMTLLNSLLFFQPLNRWAIKEIKNTNELLCDAWAANLTGDNLAFAKCLLTVAEWIEHQPYNHTLVAGMSLEKSELSKRIQSLINLPDLGKQRYDLAKTGLLFSGFLFFCFVILPGFTLDTVSKAPLPCYQTITFEEQKNMRPKEECNTLLQAVHYKKEIKENSKKHNCNKRLDCFK